MRLEEFTKDGASELNQDVLNLCEVVLTLGLCQNAQADLHTLNVIAVSCLRNNLSFFRLVFLEEGADNQDCVN